MNDSDANNSSNESEDSKGAAVKIPPPLVLLSCLLIGILLHVMWPIGLLDSSLASTVGWVLVIVSLGTIISLGLRFRREEVDIEPWKPTSKIMSSGLYAYSRNPIYLSFALLLIGIGLAQNSFWIFVSFVPATLIIYRTAIAREEKYLEQKFGDEYRQYKARVRRWL